MRILSCEHLSLGYENREIVHDLSFTVDTGDYLCIVGENGSGKTTLMKTLLGLIPPLAGRIVRDAGSAGIGYLPQQTDVQRDFPASVTEVVLSGCQKRAGLRPFYNREEKARAKEAMARMGLEGFEKRCYRELSGGQQQRVLLARALCAADELLLLDEPVSGLDPKVTADMYALIDALHARGVTIIMISHDIAAAVKYADHILHVGSDVFFGTTADYLASPVAAGFTKGGNA